MNSASGFRRQGLCSIDTVDRKEVILSPSNVRSRRAGVSFALVCALALAFIAAGCRGTGTAPDDPVALAAERTLGMQTGRFHMSIGPTMSWAQTNGWGLFSVPDGATVMSLSCCPGPGDAEVVMELRMLYPVWYFGFLEGNFPNEKVTRWMKVDLRRALAKQMWRVAPELQVGAAQSPVEDLELLRSSKHAKKVGATTIGGVRTTHYEVTVPERIDVWVGDDGLVRRLSEDLGSAGIVITNLSQFGTPVHVEAPPAELTVRA